MAMKTKKILLLLFWVCISCIGVHAQSFIAAFQIKDWQPASSVPDPSDFKIKFYFDTNPGNVLTETATSYVVFKYGNYGTGTLFVEVKMTGLGAMNVGWKIGWPFTIEVQQVKHGTSTVIAQTSYKDILPQQSDAWWADGVSKPALSLSPVATIGIEIANNPEICPNDTGKEVIATVKNSTNYTITWPAGITSKTGSPNIGIIQPGSFPYKSTPYQLQVSVKDNVDPTSIATTNFELTVKPAPTLKPELAYIPNPTCLNEEVTLNVTNVETGVTYNWTPEQVPPQNGSSAVYKPTSKTTKYSVQPEINGCMGTESAQIALAFNPDLAIGRIDYECFIDKYDAKVAVPGDVMAYSDPAATLPILNAQMEEHTTLKFMGLDSGTKYTFWVKGDDLCGIVPVVLEHTCNCNATLALSGGGSFCEDTPKMIVMDVTVNSEFKSWSFELKDPDGDAVVTVADERAKKQWLYTPLKSGTYTVDNFEAKNSAGSACGSITGGPIAVTIHPKPTVSFVASSHEDCFGEPLKLTATPGNPAGSYNYVWKGPGADTKNSAVVNTTFAKGKNNYSVKIQDKTTLCYSNETVPEEIIGHHVDVSINGPNSVANGATTNLTAVTPQDPSDGGAKIVSYVWQGTGGFTGPSSGATQSTVQTGSLTALATYTLTVTDHFGCTFTSPDKKINVTGSVLDVVASGASGCSGDDIVLTATGQGGSGRYTYAWETDPLLKLDDVTAQNPKVTSATPSGEYNATVTVDDGVSKKKSVPVKVTVKPKPKLSNVTATPSTAINSAIIDLAAEVDLPTAALRWTPENLIATGKNGNNATTVTITQSETFTISADLDGCTDEKTVFVEIKTSELQLTVEGSSGCAGTNGLTVEAKPVGGVKEYDIKWGESYPAGVVLSSKTALKPVIQNSEDLAGTYQIPVTVTDKKGQSKEAKAIVNIYPKAKATGSGFCKNATTFDGQIEMTVGTAPYKVYSDQGATQEVTGIVWTANKGLLPDLVSGTTYTYYVKDNNNCNTVRVDLQADCSCGAQLVMIPGEKACAGNNSEMEISLLVTGGTSYSFDLVNIELGTTVFSVRNEAGPWPPVKIKYADRGSYRVDNFVAVTTNSAPGTCEGNVTPNKVDIQFYPTPIVNAGTDKLVCGRDSVVLKATGTAITYNWDKGIRDGEGFYPQLNTVVEYTVTGVDANNCSNTDKVVISTYEKPDVDALATPTSVCKGQLVNLIANGNADEYVWNNGGVTGPNNMPETTTRYTVTGTSHTTGCSDTSSVMVFVNLPAEIAEKPKDRTIAIGKDVTYKVVAIGDNLSYEWRWYNKLQDQWVSFTDNTTGTPKVSGAITAELKLEMVPQSWDGRKIKCVVSGACGTPVEAEAMLWVKECFDIVADLKMGEGIRPSDSSDSQVDGWYCKGNRISLKAIVNLADPENGAVANPHYTWTIDGLPANKVIESDSSVLSWVPEYYEDDIVVKVCVYSDGACSEACSKYLRLKARTPDDVKMQIVTSIDPDRMFCPGESVDFTVALKNEGKNSNIHWYRDIFDKGTGIRKTFVMDQKDTWVKAVFEPSPELCVEKQVYDSVFLRVKEYVKPTLRIENNIHDSVACQGDTLLFHAIWTDAGQKPELRWRQDIWDRGYGEYVAIGLNEKDTWVKCWLTPGNDVCFDHPALVDSMVIRVREAGTLSISTDMTNKHPGDELTFISEVEGMTGTWRYNWYVNGNQTICQDKDYITDLLRQGDIVEAAISGNEVCLNKIFSNKIRVDYEGFINRDTMLVIYAGEKIKDLDMVKTGDDIKSIIFRIDIAAGYGMATFTPDGKFTYIPNAGFVGTDYVKYVIINKLDKTIIAEGYIYVTVKDNKRFLVPNLITPNDDGLNDTWKLDFLSDYPNHRVTIFDRNGRIVLESANYQSDWDGTGYNKGSYVGYTNLLNGVYTYVIELGDKNKTVLKSWIEIRANMNRRDYR